MTNIQDRLVQSSSSYSGPNLNLTNIYQRIREAEHGTGYIAGLFGSALGLMIYLRNCSDEVLKFFAKGWPVLVVISGSALLGMAVEYLYNSYRNRENNQQPVMNPNSDTISNQRL